MGVRVPRVASVELRVASEKVFSRQSPFIPRVAGFLLAALLMSVSQTKANVPLEGFIPLVGMGLTDEFQDSGDPTAATTFFLSQPSVSPGGQSLGAGGSPFYDIALFDTGAATHILSPSANTNFDIDGAGFDGTNVQLIGGATGTQSLRINDPLGVYMAGFADRTGAGSQLTFNRSDLSGQTSFATLSGGPQWTLPNIIGLPMAAQHAIHIQSSNPQIFEHQGRTVRTPNIEMNAIGSGGQGILRRAQMNLNPGASFIQGPIYIQNLDFNTLTLHENPLSPTVVQSGGLFIDVDIANDGEELNDTRFLFDTGASLTVISTQTAVRLGFDPLVDTADFTLAVEGSGGVSAGIPGFIADEFSLDTAGGSFTLENVPLAVLDVTDPSDPGNIVPGILGMNVFAGRDLVIDAVPSLGAGGNPPALYISDPVTQSCTWTTPSPTGAFQTGANWSGNATPDVMCDTLIQNVSGVRQQAVMAADATVYRTTIGGGSNAAEMAVIVGAGTKLTTFADIDVREGGRLHLAGTGATQASADAQFVDLNGGTLSGHGHIFVGTGPLDGTVRNIGGVISPGDPLGIDSPVGTIDITGDLANEGTMVFDLGGRLTGEADRVDVDRFAFLDGTLRVDLVDLGMGTFAPQIGDTFTLISAGEGVVGEFSDLVLPNGFSWDVNYTSNLVRLQVTGLGFTGDFDGDMDLDIDDINLLTSVSGSGGGGGGVFDLTGDGVVDVEDVRMWVEDLYGSIMGDANLDFSVDASDFNLWNGAKFTNNGLWGMGDFNADGVTDTSDFNIWNAFKFQSVDAVPEPSGLGLLVVGLALVGLRRRK